MIIRAPARSPSRAPGGIYKILTLSDFAADGQARHVLAFNYKSEWSQSSCRAGDGLRHADGP